MVDKPHYLAHGAPIQDVVPLVEPLCVLLIAQLSLNLDNLGIFATCSNVQDFRTHPMNANLRE